MIWSVRCLRVSAPVALLLAAMLALSYPAHASVPAVRAARSASAAGGANLLVNPRGTMVLAGSTAVVVDTYAGQITLIGIRTGHVFAPVTVGNYPAAVAISG